MSTKGATHRGRVERAIELGRARDKAVAQMAAGTTAERWLAAVAGFGDRDGARTLALLGDASRRVRGMATVLAPLACDDDQAVAALETAWSMRRERPLLRRMARRGRTAAIDRFLDGLAARGALRELVDALPFGSEAAVRRHHAIAIARPSDRWWRGLAGQHPAVLADVLIERWRAVDGEADPVTRQRTAAHHAAIAARVPEAALALAEVLLARKIEPGPDVWTALLRHRPDATVALAIAHAQRLPAGLFRHRAAALAPALLARIVAHAPALLALGRWVRELSEPQQAALARGWVGAIELHPAVGSYLLRYVPGDVAPADRERAYVAWSTAARDRDGAIDPELVAALPRDLAAREGRRHLTEVVALATDPARRITGYARHVPWAELVPLIAPTLGHPEGELRAVALREQLAIPGLDVDDATLPPLALAMVTARKFEQDPVRRAMIETLAAWPRRVWRPEHLPAIDAVLRDMLDAADCSVATAAAGERLVVRLFGVDAGWAATWLATMIKERGQLHDPRLGAKLGEDDLRAAAPALLGIARTWARQERYHWLAELADSLGRRLGQVGGLASVVAAARDTAVHEGEALMLTRVLARHEASLHDASLESTVARFRKQRWWTAIITLAREHGARPGLQVPRRDRRKPTLPPALAGGLGHIVRECAPKHAGPAAAVLRRRAPAAFDSMIGDLVRHDTSTIGLPDVTWWIHRHRQDLLDAFLGGRTVTGRHATGASAWVLHFAGGFFRWTPAQAEAYAGDLDRLIGDPARDTPAILRALPVRAAIEYADQAPLAARASDERPAVKEKAIRVLARCDAGQGVPTLLACLADERARFAIYGLRRALFEMLPDRAVALLADVSLRKVTVGKEVVRLLGELRTPAGLARLDAIAAGTLHRDVRIALLRALWDHLDRDATWTIFERAVADPDWITASRLGDIPANRLTADTDRRLAALLARVLDRPEPEARIALLIRAGSLALVDRDRTFLAACRGRLASRHDDEVTAAVRALLLRATETDAPELAATLDALRADPRALHVAVTTLAAHDLRTRASWKLFARAAIDVACRDPRWSCLAVTAAGRLADGAFLATLLDALAAASALDHDALTAAFTALALLPPEQLSATRGALAASPHPLVRRAAVHALALDAGPSRGWTPARLAALSSLRADASPTVAGAAARLWPPRETDPR